MLFSLKCLYKDSQMSDDVYVLCVSIIPPFASFLLNLGNIMTVCYVLLLGNMLTVSYALFLGNVLTVSYALFLGNVLTVCYALF